MNKLFASTLLLIAGAVLGGLGAGSAFGYNIPQVKYSINEEHANDMLSRRIERLNRPVLDSIASLSASLDTIGTRLDKAVRIKDAVTGFLAAEKLKLKEKDQKEACAAVVREVLAGMSRDRILQYAEQKNRDKANSDKNREEALNKLSAKTAESLVKNTQKGNVADTHLSALLRDVLEEETLAAENLTVEKAVAEAGLTRLKASIIKAPEKFSAEFFNKIMDDEEIPVKKTTLTQAEHPGPSYEDLMRRYSNRELSTIRGKFDGVITDELTIFPDENSRVYDNPCGPDYEAYHRYIVKSKYGTTPDLVASSEASIDI